MKSRGSLKKIVPNLLFDFLNGPQSNGILFENKPSFLERFVSGKKFDFVFNESSNQSKMIEFVSNGRIGQGRNNNEHSWRIDNDKLIILNDKNQIYSRFIYDKETRILKNTNEYDTLSLRNQYMIRLV